MSFPFPFNRTVPLIGAQQKEPCQGTSARQEIEKPFFAQSNSSLDSTSHGVANSYRHLIGTGTVLLKCIAQMKQPLVWTISGRNPILVIIFLRYLILSLYSELEKRVDEK